MIFTLMCSCRHRELQALHRETQQKHLFAGGGAGQIRDQIQEKTRRQSGGEIVLVLEQLVTPLPEGEPLRHVPPQHGLAELKHHAGYLGTMENEKNSRL